MRNKVQLITYVDRLGKNLPGLIDLMKNEFTGLFGGVHLLPIYYPIDGTDSGFDPADHAAVDSRLGNWANVNELSRRVPVMLDLIVNHISSESPQFQDVVQHGEQSQYWDLFLKRSDVFATEPDATTLERIHRPRPGSPFTTKRLANNKDYNFWTTFSDRQIDINVESNAGQDYLRNILNVFSAGGVSMIRLDAAGYAIKRPGTSCFMLPETFEFIERIATAAAAAKIEVLVEIHSHYQTQIQISEKVPWVYDFALPPLVLHTLFTGNTTALKDWLRIAPRNCITVLDTHDGIGIVDAAKEGDKPGLLADNEIDNLVEEIHRRSNGDSLKASGHAASNVDIYQVNCTYFDALGQCEKCYLLARAVQLFAPGIPQIYYVGLLAAGNDM
ncbi:MAG: sucrose phosphorylase, partial [Pseudomonadales bacterium]